MKDAHSISEALSFDDVLLKPARSEVLPREVSLATRFTKNVSLNIPLVSAAMDTVTEAELAIALAQQGGIGVIHKNMTIDDHAAEVDRVKRSQAGMITNPFTLSPDRTVEEAENLMGRFKVSGVPITDAKGKLVGILTNRDLMFLEKYDTPIAEVMTKDDLVTAPPGTTLEEAKRLLHQHRIEKLPIVNPDGTLAGLITIKDITKAREFPHSCRDELGRLRVAGAVGAGAAEVDRAKALCDAHIDVLVVDTAHGHSKMVLETIGLVKEHCPGVDVVAGNVVTAQGAKDLIAAGADAVKVGVGPGSICTTRVVSGAGMPQITAVMEVVSVAREKGVPVISDGGIKFSGDITKAIAAGADSVMIGSLFAGTAESPGEMILFEGRPYKVYRGMGSLKAMQKGSKTRYMQFETDANKLVPEGVEGRVAYRGPLADYVHQLIGGLRSGMGYCGCNSIRALQENTEFIRVTAAGMRESHVHDVAITEEPPNYQVMR